jgi:hypothetical protein
MSLVCLAAISAALTLGISFHIPEDGYLLDSPGHNT